jgi:hypothetical protein
MPTAEYDCGPRRPGYRDLLAAYGRARDAWEAEPRLANYAVLETGVEILYRALAEPGKFPLGHVLLTPGATEALFAAQQIPPEFLLRHLHGDWGELCAEDRRENERALRAGARLLSSYRTLAETTLWVITDADRRATTLLLPEES